MALPLLQVDVFSAEPYRGNPVAVVLGADGLSGAAMQRFANWTNLSETTFVLAPSAGGADYRVRIFTPDQELPFAGHPTLGTCHAWLTGTAAGRAAGERVVQECAAGLIEIRRDGGRLAFAAPPLVRDGPVEERELAGIAAQLGIEREAIADAQWADNGPGWVAVLLGGAEAVLALRPTRVEREIGVVGPHPAGAAAAWELRAFLPFNGVTVEDPVTGSLNASVAQWLLGSGRASVPYVARQGTALGRDGRIHVDRDADGTIWIGGDTTTCIRGEVDL